MIAILLPALIFVESGGRADAVGDNGAAVGILQIQLICLEDVNRIWSTNYAANDRYDRRKSAEIAILYLWHYGKAYEQKTGEPASLEVLAKIWNGGPFGYKKEATEKYWKKVERVLYN